MSALSRLRGPLARRLGVHIGARGRVVFELPLGRRTHTVRVDEQGRWLRVEGRIARLASGEIADPMSVRDLLGTVLQANKATELVAFARNDDGWLVARCDLPGFAPVEEVERAVWSVARIADRWEEVWVGDDRQ